jgi:endogenous inhibitor of DNA gyrase (YacG/DUF329 family)
MSRYSMRQLDMALQTYEHFNEVECVCVRCGRVLFVKDLSAEKAWCDECHANVPLINPLNEWLAEVQAIARATRKEKDDDKGRVEALEPKEALSRS